ncbi:MAG: ERCC4 domain-containing protein [Syntrophorhabdales bacterium]
MTGKGAVWILETSEHARFPYIISIVQGDETILRVRAQEKWPGGGSVFCLRDDGSTQVSHRVESVPIISLRHIGKRLAVVLDRLRNRRCDFLILAKRYKKKEGEYEQIFFRTERALSRRGPRTKLSCYPSGELNVLVSASERYAWNFPPGCVVRKGNLNAGDYALTDKKGDIIAVVERKTFSNLLAEFGRMPILHLHLTDLEAHKHAALVVESGYDDLFRPKLLKYYTPSFAAMAIAEIHALHPGLSIVFAGSRKLAAEWTVNFFRALKALEKDSFVAPGTEAIGGSYVQENPGGRYFAIKRAIVEDFPSIFTISQALQLLPEAPLSLLRTALAHLRSDGELVAHKRGKKSYWERIGGQPVCRPAL